MSISYEPRKIKKIIGFVLVLILVLLLAYAIATLSVGMTKKSPISIVYPANTASAIRAVEIKETKTGTNTFEKNTEMNGSVVASKKGTKYHLPSCPGAKTIAGGNKIIFPSAEAAKKAGYTPAKNCKGLNL